MILKRKLRIQIYNSTETEVEYDSDIDTTWGITAGSASLESLIMEEELRYGDLNSSIFQVQVFNINADISKRKIVVTVIDTVDTQSYIVDDAGNYLVDDAENKIIGIDGTAEINKKIFTGWIDSAKQDHSGVYRDIIAYDWIYYHREDNVASWWNDLWGQGFTSMVLSGVRDNLLTYMDVDFNIPAYLINDDLLVKNNFVNATNMSVLKFETVMQMICILQNVSPHINGDGVFTLIHLDSTPIEVTDNLETENSIYEDYITNPITGIAVYDTSDNLVQVVGTNTNVYKIIGNLFLLNLTAQELTNACTPILNDLSIVRYTPASLSLIVSNLDYELGNKFQTDKGTTYAFRTQIYGSLFVNQVLESFAFGANLNPDVYSENEDLMIGNKIARVEKNIDGLNIQFADLERNVSTEIGILADEIVMKVDLSGNMVEVALGEDPSSSGATIFKVKADNIELSASETISLMSGGDINLNAGNGITITSPGFSVTRAGAITSTSGKIGGFNIGASTLDSLSQNELNQLLIQALPTGTPGNQIAYCVRTRETTASAWTYPFVVRWNGTVEMTKATVTGTITTDNLTATGGLIGAWHITPNSLYSEWKGTGTDAGKEYRLTLRTNNGNANDGAIYTRYIPRADAPSSEYEYPTVIRYDGTVLTTKLNATGGVIGGWSISDSQLYKTSTDSGYTNTVRLNPTILQMDSVSAGAQFRITMTGTGITGYSKVSTSGSFSQTFLINGNQGIVECNQVTTGAIKAKSSGINVECTDFKVTGTNAGVTLQPYNADSFSTYIEMFGKSPFIDFHRNNSTWDYTSRMICEANAEFRFLGRTAASTVVNATLRAGNYATDSSKYLKKNIKSITENEAKKLLKLRPVSFDYKYVDMKNQRGLIAEEVLDIYPEMVNVPSEYTEFDADNPSNSLSIDYSKFVPYLIKMVQVQQKEIDALKKSIK